MKIFTDYFNENKADIKAVCFLFSPHNPKYRSKKYYQFSLNYLQDDPEKRDILDQVIAENPGDFVYDQKLAGKI